MRTCSSASDVRARGVAVVLLAAASVSSCGEEADIPTPPDLSSLESSYEHPDGVVNAQSVAASFADARRIATTVLETGLGPFLRESSRRVQENIDARLELIRDRDRLDLDDIDFDVVVRIRRICVGWGDPTAPPDAATNGAVELTAVARNDLNQPVAWGATIGRCLQTTTIAGLPARLLLEGEIATSGTSENLPLLVRFTGTFGSNLATANGTFDFRVTPSGQIEVRVPASAGGTLIFFLGAGEVGVRGSNGRFVCSEGTHLCTGPSGEIFQW